MTFLHSTRRIVLAGLGWAAGLLLLVPLSVAAAPTKTAADIVPADCAFFDSSLQLRQQFETIAHSQAVRQIIELPLVQQQLAQLQDAPQYQQAMAMLEVPLAKELTALVKDASSDEIFIYGGKGWAEALGILLEFQQQNMLATLGALATRQEPKPFPVIIGTVLKHRDLKLPPIVLGFKVADTARVDRLTEQLQAFVEISPVPVKLQKRSIGGGSFVTLELSGKMLPMTRDQFAREMANPRTGVSEFQAGELYDWLMDQTLAVTVGHLRGYLLLSIAGSNDHLGQLGQGSILADRSELDPIRKHLGERLLGLSYVSLELMSLNQFDAQGTIKTAEDALNAFRALLPPALPDRLIKDIRLLAKGLEQAMPKPSAAVSVTLRNRGVESYSYSKSITPGIEYSKPLTILGRLGSSKPLIAVAWGSESSTDEYQAFVDGVKKLYGYWTDFGLTLLNAEQRAQYEQVAEIALPFFARLEEITRTKLVPATDAGQGLFVIDAQMRLSQLPEVPPFPKPMPFPELALGCTLQDGKLFRQAIEEYVAAVEEVVPKIAELTQAPIPQPFRIPRPVVTPFGQGEMFFYPLPPVVDRALLPHAILDENLLLLSSSPAQSRRMYESTSIPRNDVVQIDGPSGAVILFHPGALLSAAREWLDFAAQQPNSPLAPPDPAARDMIKTHVDAVFDLLGTFKVCASRSYRDGEYLVSHTWAHFEDVAR